MKLIIIYPAYYETIYNNLVNYDIFQLFTFKFQSAFINPNVAVFKLLHIIDTASRQMNAPNNIPIKNPFINTPTFSIPSFFISPPHTATLKQYINIYNPNTNANNNPVKANPALYKYPKLSSFVYIDIFQKFTFIKDLDKALFTVFVAQNENNPIVNAPKIKFNEYENGYTTNQITIIKKNKRISSNKQKNYANDSPLIEQSIKSTIPAIYSGSTPGQQELGCDCSFPINQPNYCLKQSVSSLQLGEQFQIFIEDVLYCIVLYCIKCIVLYCIVYISTKYLGSLVNFTRTFITTNYQKLPMKPLKFVEKMIVMADNLSSPYVEGITDLMENNINKSFQIVQSYEKKIGITEQGSRLKQKGQEIKDSLKDQSKKVIDQGMDLAVKNSASQYLMNTCDRVADKDEWNNVVQNGKATDEEQSKFKSKYNKRVTRLAHNITDLSCGLVQLLGKEMQILGGSSYIRVQTMIKQHINSIIYVVKLVIYTSMLNIYGTSKQQVVNVLSILKLKLNNKELISYLLNELNVLKQQLTISQFKQYYSLLIQSLIDLKILNKLKQQGQIVVQNYKEQLKNDEVKILEPLKQEIEIINQQVEESAEQEVNSD